MAANFLFRTALFRWLAGPRRTRTAKRPRLALESLEGRETPAVGGGFTAGGIVGEYYDNPNLNGSPAFTRRDVRIDFDWQTAPPGGSSSPAYRRVGADHFSVRWTGQVVPRFSETYTFRTATDDGVRLWIKPAGEGGWVKLIDNWNPQAGDENTRRYAMNAGQAYDLKMEFYEDTGDASARLTWSSPSTPEEVIDPVVNLGVNAVTYDFHTYADATKMGRAEWGDPVDYFGRSNVGTDGNGWPTSDAGHVFWEGQDPAKTNGVYELRFRGSAEVVSWFGKGRFRVDGRDYGPMLPAGTGYDPGSNTTVAQVVVTGADLFGMTFKNTRRDGGAPNNSGITDVKLMRPVEPGSGVSYNAEDVFDTHIKEAYAKFTTLRYLTANFNAEREWTDRKRPEGPKAAWGDRAGVWEYQVMLANETGKDLYITIPINASNDYVHKLAKLLKYGSDGSNAYDHPMSNPRYPGLDPNLRLYVEWGNEVWNWGFEQSRLGVEAARQAVHNNTPEGRIINYDGQRPDGDYRRYTALRTVRASETFRDVWGDADMGDRVRVVLEYQYDNIQDTALEALRFLDNYFNNGDGRQNVSDPKPVNYYIWGAGGATYFGATNPRGLADDIEVPDGGFEGVPMASGRSWARPSGSPWQFSGDAGVYKDPDGFGDNQRVGIDGIGPVPTTPAGGQAMFISGDGTATVSINFPKAGVYAIDFQAAAEAGPDMGNSLDFYFDDDRVTPNAAGLTPNPQPWRPGNGFGRNPEQYIVYGTVPVKVNGGGRHTFKIVGRGNGNQTTVIDDVRVASVDEIFASRLPGGGQAAGQVSIKEYQKQLANQSRFALAYGLKVVAYEGGWSLGGDHDALPIMSYAKYKDPRAATANAEAIDSFYRAGGELNVLGTYDQWKMDDGMNADEYPLVRGVTFKGKTLRAESAAGAHAPGTLTAVDRSSDVTNGNNNSGYLKPGEWLSWNVLAPTSGDYRVTAATSGGGKAGLSVDGDEIDEGDSGRELGDVVRLTKGMHTIRVQSMGGEFFAQSVNVTRMRGPAANPEPDPIRTDTPEPVAQPKPAPAPRPAPTPTSSGLPDDWRSEDINGPDRAGSARLENGRWTVNGAGEAIWGASDQFQFANTTVDGDSVLVARIDGVEGSHARAKGGVMVRSGTGASAAFAGVFATAGHGVEFQWRTRFRAAPQSVEVPVDGPVWVKLVRRGNSFSASYSTDGQKWTRLGSPRSIAMPSSVRAGLAVTSRDASQVATATFTNVSVS
ncbi:MAG TPA: PA14 domain-containing protein [Gemmataceae bacterium]|nr:PA14 domain-containing protein [Gemmataceae bacterium]